MTVTDCPAPAVCGLVVMLDVRAAPANIEAPNMAVNATDIRSTLRSKNVFLFIFIHSPLKNFIHPFTHLDTTQKNRFQES
jgi:hypothetical protein